MATSRDVTASLASVEDDPKAPGEVSMPLGVGAADAEVVTGSPAAGADPVQAAISMRQFTKEEYTDVASGGQGSSIGAQIVAEAMRYKGTPYVWGGTGPLGVDCSGLTSMVFKKFGINLPRVSYQQGGGGAAVGMDQLQAGDLVFWDTSSRNKGADHVAIYIGNGQMIEANRPGGSVTVSKLRTNGAWARRWF